jgi:hypothetical protein
MAADCMKNALDEGRLFEFAIEGSGEVAADPAVKRSRTFGRFCFFSMNFRLMLKGSIPAIG